MAKKETIKEKKIEVMRQIKMSYTDAESQKMGRQMAYALSDIDSFKQQAKDAASDYKNKISGKETEVKILKDNINLGYQMVTKSCILIKNFDSQKREYWYDGKVVDEEPLTKDDYQTELNLAEEENKKEADRVDKLEKEKAEGDPQKNGEVMSIGKGPDAPEEKREAAPATEASTEVVKDETTKTSSKKK